MHVRLIHQQSHAFASGWRLAGVDPRDDLLSGDQLVLGDT